MTISVDTLRIVVSGRPSLARPAHVEAVALPDVEPLDLWEQEVVDLIFEEIVEANFGDERPVPRRPRPGAAARRRRHADEPRRGYGPRPSVTRRPRVRGYLSTTGGRGRGPPAQELDGAPDFEGGAATGIDRGR